MLISTKGIVIRTIKYAESSIIARIYTKHYGLQSYIIHGVRKAKSKNKAALFLPLTLLEMEVYHRENKQIQRIKEFKLAYTFQSIPFNIIKSTISMFITEILHKSLKEEAQNNEQFDFLYHFILLLDLTQENLSLFQIYFMIQWSSILGFRPNDNYHPINFPYFDLSEGSFVAHIPPHPQFISPPYSQQFKQLLSSSQSDLTKYKLNKNNRYVILKALILYFQLHIDGFGELKSLDILKEVMK